MVPVAWMSLCLSYRFSALFSLLQFPDLYVQVPWSPVSTEGMWTAQVASHWSHASTCAFPDILLSRESKTTFCLEIFPGGPREEVEFGLTPNVFK